MVTPGRTGRPARPTTSLAARRGSALCGGRQGSGRNIVVITAVIASLFLVIGAAEPFAAWLRLPSIVILAALGILIGAGALFFLRTALTDALDPIALFGLFMGFVVPTVPDPILPAALGRFPVLVGGGVLVGSAMARAALWVMGLFGRHDLAVISVSVALPYLAYITAEQGAGASGVIAVVTAGFALSLMGPGRLLPRARTNLREVWDPLAHWAGALIFILAALLVPRLLGDVRLADAALVAVVVGAAILARAVILFGLLPPLTLLRLSPAVERPCRVAIL